jgi:hypothetical protein
MASRPVNQVGERWHLPDGVVGQHLHERGDVGVLERGGIPVQQRAALWVGGPDEVGFGGCHLLELSSSPLQGAVDRGGRGVKQAGDLSRPPCQHVAQDQHGPLPWGEVLEGGNQGQPQALSCLHDGGGVGRPLSQQAVGDGLEPWHLRQPWVKGPFRVVARAAQPGRQRPAGGTLQRSQRRCGRDPVQPGAQRRPPWNSS